MQLVTDNAKTGFAKIMHAVKDDPYSWEKWHVLHLHIEPNETFLSDETIATHYLRSQLHGRTGVVYLCDPHNFFIFSRDEGETNLLSIGSDFADEMHETHGFTCCARIYHLSSEWQQMPNYTQHHISNKYTPIAASSATNALNETMHAMLDVLAANMDSRPHRNALKLLLVEDDPLSRKMVLKHLRKDHHIVTAATAQEAVTQYAFHAPDIVLLDIGLPDYPGFHVMEAIQAHDPEAYIVMFSGNDFLENISHCIHTGANGFIGKPLQQERLNHYLDACEAQRQ